MYNLNGRVAVVTGAGSGIGRGIALRLAAEGGVVVSADIDGAAAERLSREIREEGKDSFHEAADVSSEKDVLRLFDATVKRFGGVDILVNNAGVGTTGLIINHTLEDWEKSMTVNLRGTFLCSRAAAKIMIPRRKGRIVNIASIGGKEGEEFIGGYCSSKFGVIGLTQVMAKELGRHGITVNAVCPGYIWTPMWEKMAVWFGETFPALAGKKPEEIFEARVKSVTPLRRPQTPEDIAALVAFLVSDEAKNINGQSINVDGGAKMH
ncbi:MAG TPA: SDR family NAD(P)-dependent oxidoreductase [Thermodesulfobacteriota bacterium]|nr:SDR family NAD(P)-dependent oxidoreductase [Thermodesulfobacteriota bacterium]